MVAGFQGVSTDREITTLGRGGSDATAVALAAVLGADACEIYTDVTGVFTADPRVVPTAHRINRITFEEMLEIAATGGPRPQLRAVEFARNHNVPLHVRSSFTWEPGTWVVEEDADMEEAIVTAVTHDTSEAKVTVSGLPDRPGVAARLFRAQADRSINVDMIVQNTSAARHHRHLLHRAQDRPGRLGRDRAGAAPTSSGAGRHLGRRRGPGLADRRRA